MNKNEKYDLMSECQSEEISRYVKINIRIKVREFTAFVSGVDGRFVVSYVKRFEQS